LLASIHLIQQLLVRLLGRPLRDHALVFLGTHPKFLVVDIRVEFSFGLLIEEVDDIFRLIAHIMDHSLSSLVENIYEDGLLAHDREFYGLLDKTTLSFT
tara:strand:- start:202 stop:498 length:297 start_codon:yes stop_codon:yes gene_type:complete